MELLIDNCTRFGLIGHCKGGSAMHKARNLNALQDPSAHYNDRILCIPSGLNKTTATITKFTNIDSLNEANLLNQFGIKSYKEFIELNAPMHLNANTTNITLAQNTNIVSVTPNPATTQITIKYQCSENGTFVLYNSVGQIVLQTTLDKNSSTVVCSLVDLANGVYQYEIDFPTCTKTKGKLTVLK